MNPPRYQIDQVVFAICTRAHPSEPDGRYAMPYRIRHRALSSRGWVYSSDVDPVVPIDHWSDEDDFFASLSEFEDWHDKLLPEDQFKGFYSWSLPHGGGATEPVLSDIPSTVEKIILGKHLDYAWPIKGELYIVGNNFEEKLGYVKIGARMIDDQLKPDFIWSEWVGVDG